MSYPNTVIPSDGSNFIIPATDQNLVAGVTPEITHVIEVGIPGPQGPAGPQGPSGERQATGSFLTTASYLAPNLKFSKGDGTKFEVEVTHVTHSITSSYATTSSFSLASITSSHSITSSYIKAINVDQPFKTLSVTNVARNTQAVRTLVWDGDTGVIGYVTGSLQQSSLAPRGNTYIIPATVSNSPGSTSYLTGSVYEDCSVIRLAWTGGSGVANVYLPDCTTVTNTYRAIRFIAGSNLNANNKVRLRPSGLQTLDGSTGYYELKKAYEGIMVWSDGEGGWVRVQTKA